MCSITFHCLLLLSLGGIFSYMSKTLLDLFLNLCIPALLWPLQIPLNPGSQMSAGNRENDRERLSNPCLQNRDRPVGRLATAPEANVPRMVHGGTSFESKRRTSGSAEHTTSRRYCSSCLRYRELDHLGYFIRKRTWVPITPSPVPGPENIPAPGRKKVLRSAGL